MTPSESISFLKDFFPFTITGVISGENNLIIGYMCKSEDRIDVKRLRRALDALIADFNLEVDFEYLQGNEFKLMFKQ